MCYLKNYKMHGATIKIALWNLLASQFTKVCGLFKR